jgi:hypothetical protein
LLLGLVSFRSQAPLSGSRPTSGSEDPEGTPRPKGKGAYVQRYAQQLEAGCNFQMSKNTYQLLLYFERMSIAVIFVFFCIN